MESDSTTHSFDRALEETRAREAALREILQVISQSRDNEKPVFDAILSSAVGLCGVPLAGMHLANAERTAVELVAHMGMRPRSLELWDKAFAIESQMVIARATREAEVVHVKDMADDDLYRSGNPARVTVVDVEGTRTLLAVPLIREGEGLGCIWMFRRDVAPFSDTEIDLLRSFAAQAVIAIENVRQFKALEASNAVVQTQAEELQSLNASLEERIEEQVTQIERLGRLKQFLPPAVADAVMTQGEEMLSSHRALIASLFCDIRGFTAFCETAEPEETIEVLQTFHEELGALIPDHGGGVEKRLGDGIMVIFNDPLPIDDPARSAVRLAVAMQSRMAELCKGWSRLGHRLGFGVGVAFGYATVGLVGSAPRFDYTANGSSVNLAARLCDKAADGEILISPRARASVEDAFPTESLGEMSFKGIQKPTEVFRLLHKV